MNIPADIQSEVHLSKIRQIFIESPYLFPGNELWTVRQQTVATLRMKQVYSSPILCIILRQLGGFPPLYIRY